MKALYDIYKNPNKFNMNSPLHHWLEQRGNESLKKLEHRIGHGPEYKLKFAASHPHFWLVALT